MERCLEDEGIQLPDNHLLLHGAVCVPLLCEQCGVRQTPLTRVWMPHPRYCEGGGRMTRVF